MPISPRVYRPLTTWYFAFTGLATVLFVLLYGRVSRAWVIADWLINYEGGFIRRGLPGEIALILSRLLHINPAVFPILFCLLFYSVFLVAAWRLALLARPSWWTVALLTSPATFDYQVLDMTGGGRKEIIYLAALAVFLLLLRKNRLSPAMVSVYLSVTLVFGVLAHESIYLYAPYFFAALLLAGRSVKQAALQCALPFTLVTLVAIACALHQGDRAIESHICASLGQAVSDDWTSNEICSGLGSMAYLTVGPTMARDATVFVAAKYHYALLYPLLAILAFLPVIGSSAELSRYGEQKKVRALWSVALFPIVASVALFVFAIDWGRWIYIHTAGLALLLLFIGRAQPLLAPEVAAGKSLKSSVSLSPSTALLLVLNATCWTLPHANLGASMAQFGYVNLIVDVGERLHRHLARPTPKASSNTAIRPLSSLRLPAEITG